MKTCIYLLLGINVSGHNMIKMEALKTKLKLRATTRNWRTVNELIKMDEEISK